MSLKKNVIANYVGQGWQALMGIAFVPMYIQYLGIEAYGLIGIFAILQSWLVLLDMGMRPALGREMARFTGGAHSAQSIWDLLRSIELIAITLAGGVAIAIWAESGWLASHWVKSKSLPMEAVAQAFAAMGLVTALRFVETLYTSSIIGLQRQIQQNVITSISSTVRALGAVALLAWVSPTIPTFFLWQALISVVTVVLFAGIVYRTLPPAPRRASFSLVAIAEIRRFAAGMLFVTLLALLLTQVDKLLLSRMLTLESFGYYALAGVVASSINTLTGPITTALYPRFTELVTCGDEIALTLAYHMGSQSVTVVTGSAAIILVLFGDRVLFLWTGNATLTQQVAPLVSILAVGSLLNGLMWNPQQLQLAHGWTSLGVRVNTVAVSLLVPAILLIVPSYGASGAAWVWVALNTGYLIIGVPLMHRRLLAAEKWRWYVEDVLIPLTAASTVAILCRWMTPKDLGKTSEVIFLLITSALTLLAAALVAPLLREQLARHLPVSITSTRARAV